jgi:hypothetical protein
LIERLKKGAPSRIRIAFVKTWVKEASGGPGGDRLRLPTSLALYQSRQSPTVANKEHACVRYQQAALGGDMADNAKTKRQEALLLAEETLSDIELGRISALDVARKAGRLARLLDDSAAIEWLRFEVAGYPATLDESASRAAARSRRGSREGVWTNPLGSLEVEIQSLTAAQEGFNGPLPAGDWAYRISLDRDKQRSDHREGIRQRKEILDRVLGSIYEYVSERYQELRFGAAMETAFEVVRARVDSRIAELIPDALPALTAALENAASDLPEHWANAASTCRRLLKLAADALRPPGPDKQLPNGKTVKMGDGNYINRLLDWIVSAAESTTEADLIASDLEYLGKRLDAADAGGQKGAHSQVSRAQASRFITGTYLLLGDILQLKTPDVL